MHASPAGTTSSGKSRHELSWPLAGSRRRRQQRVSRSVGTATVTLWPGPVSPCLSSVVRAGLWALTNLRLWRNNRDALPQKGKMALHCSRLSISHRHSISHRLQSYVSSSSSSFQSGDDDLGQP